MANTGIPTSYSANAGLAPNNPFDVTTWAQRAHHQRVLSSMLMGRALSLPDFTGPYKLFILSDGKHVLKLVNTNIVSRGLQKPKKPIESSSIDGGPSNNIVLPTGSYRAGKRYFGRSLDDQ